MTELPYLTAELPGTGGALRRDIEDFVVEEIPAYPPSGEGDHVFAWIEKRDVSTFDAVARLAAAVGARPGDVGTAGLKDRRAVARQMISLPPPVDPDAVRAAQVEGVSVLSVTRHPHKLRTGHARGNRFALRVRDVDPTLAAQRAGAILEQLTRPPGTPNWFGEQRFGARGDNAEVGRALVHGEPMPGGRRAPRGKQRRLYISSYQSALFNRYLRARVDAGLFARVLEGDVLRKTDTGGLFCSEDIAADQARLVAGEVAPTGPMFGHKMRAPTPGTEAAAREQSILDDEGVSPEDFGRVGKLAAGTRRPIAVPLDAVAVEAEADAIVVTFTLPAGAYATAVMRELMKHNPAIPESP